MNINCHLDPMQSTTSSKAASLPTTIHVKAEEHEPSSIIQHDYLVGCVCMCLYTYV